MPRIYLSSTYEDLKEYRRVVFQALRKHDYDVIAMEDDVATDQRPVNKCLEDVAKSDIYVGVFGFRYGYVPPPQHENPEGLSITELEFRHAERLGKPCLAFLVSEDALWPMIFVDLEKDGPIHQLRRYLSCEKLAAFFSTPHELASHVQAAVSKWAAANPAPAIAAATAPATASSPARTVAWDIKKHGSPYPGLLHFTPEYAPVFFGRDVEIRTVLDRMWQPEGRFLLISGDSGVGKSSIIHAGVLPRIKQIGLHESTRPLHLRMVASQGTSPFNALIGVLRSYATEAGLVPESLEKQLDASPDRMADLFRTILTKGSDNDGLVLFLDQMEELFTRHDLDASQKFLTALYQAAQERALWVLATIRGDHLHYCHKNPVLLDVLNGPGHYPVGPIKAYVLPDLIIKPAQCAGLRIHKILAKQIISDMGAKGGHLPLLAFLLNELYTKRSNGELSEAVYNELGGVNGAIAYHARKVEAVIRDTWGTKIYALLPTLFQELVNINPEGLPTRNRPLYSVFPQEVNQIIDLLVKERLLQSEGKAEMATVAISHEALFDTWPSLTDYIAVNRVQLMAHTLNRMVQERLIQTEGKAESAAVTEGLELLMAQSGLESGALKWAKRSMPRFRGLAASKEYERFREMTLTPLAKEYIIASRRVNRIKGFLKPVVAIFLMFAFVSLIESSGNKSPIEPKMVTIPKGEFIQGDTQGGIDPTEKPEHPVRVKGFAIGSHEVTFHEYEAFLYASNRPSKRGHPSESALTFGRFYPTVDMRPADRVSWKDAKDYAAWLSQTTGKRYRLPTESEWEYAARGGKKGDIWAGTSEESQLNSYAVYESTYSEPVGSRQPNAFGLYDLSGNVWEWVEDCWLDNYKNAPVDGRAWLESDNLCTRRVLRGGSWNGQAEDIRASNREASPPDRRSDSVGFRLAFDLP